MLISHFLVTSWFDSVCIVARCYTNLSKNENFNMNISFLTSMYGRDIRFNSVFMSHGAGKDSVEAKNVNLHFLPKIRIIGHKYVHTLLSDNCSSCSCKHLYLNITQHANTMQKESNMEATQKTGPKQTGCI